MAHCITTYILASGLISAGMNWWQALITILLGNTIVLIPILLNSHPGTKYGIPFPVFARASYGTFGSNLPAIMRALVACGWFGIQAWIGGQALHTFFTSIFPAWPKLLGIVGGDAVTEHARLHALRPLAKGAGGGTDGGAADDDDAVRGDGRDHHVGRGDHLSAFADERSVGSGEAGRPLHAAGRDRDFDVHSGR